MKKTTTNLLVLAVLPALAVFTAGYVFAEDLPPDESTLAGRVEGVGTHFEITDSQYLNIALDSTEEIAVRMESVSEIVTIDIASVNPVASSRLTFSGLASSAIYYLFEDDYHNVTEFTADVSGVYTYTQDLSTPHFLILQPRKSTKIIADNSTGGDCTLIGSWDSATKTCVLTMDFSEAIQIDSDLITLDGNGHTITGSRTGFGVYLPARQKVTVKNLNIRQFFTGIYLFSGSENIAENNGVTANQYGVYLNSSSRNVIENNSIYTNESTSIFLTSYSNNNTIADNALSNRGMTLFRSSGNIITNNSITDSPNVGIALRDSDTNDIAGNSVQRNSMGIYLVEGSNGNIVRENTVVQNASHGVAVYASDLNTIKENTVQNNGSGVYLSSSFFGQWPDYNKIYHNNFISNTLQAYVISYGVGNSFNLAYPDGGNYWSNYTGRDQYSGSAQNQPGSDGTGDTPHVFSGGRDYFPWMQRDAWKKIEVFVDFDPDVLNLSSSGEYITVYIEEEKIDVSTIDVASVLLNNSVPALASPTAIGDHDNDGIVDLMVKFSRNAVQNLVAGQSQAKVIITGSLADGRLFQGETTIRIISKK